MEEEQKKVIVSKLIETFDHAGKVALDLRKVGLKKEIKDDNTPVTNGDIEVNNILIKKITELTPQIKIISEENIKNKSDNELKSFWLIDPIDGTREYINNRDEFTLNAALIINKNPVIGLINAPAKKRMFYSYSFMNSYEIFENKKINLFDRKNYNKVMKGISYSDQIKPNNLDIYKKFKISNFKKMKSSLKFCMLATCEFDFYAAEARAYEWDIAAGHAIVEHAGGKITDFNENKILYGKEDFKNSSIIVKSKRFING